jgi:hypothetical protein
MTTQSIDLADAQQTTRAVPLSYRCYRGAVVLVAVLVLLLAGLGAGGHGPFHALGDPTSAAIDWIETQMGTGA